MTYADTLKIPEVVFRVADKYELSVLQLEYAVSQTGFTALHPGFARAVIRTANTLRKGKS